MLEDFHFLGSNMWVISRQRNGARMLELRWFEIEFRQNCPFPLLSSSRATGLGGQQPRHQFANQAPVWLWLACMEFPVNLSLTTTALCPITFSGQQDSVCGIYGRSSSSSGTAGCFHGVWRRSGGGGAPRARAHQHRAAAICRKWQVGRLAPVAQWAGEPTLCREVFGWQPEEGGDTRFKLWAFKQHPPAHNLISLPLGFGYQVNIIGVNQ